VRNRVVDVFLADVVTDQHLYCVRCPPLERHPGHRWTANVGHRGVCVCARHKCVLPHGIGDLQKGER
jgi:hypothetical protein